MTADRKAWLGLHENDITEMLHSVEHYLSDRRKGDPLRLQALLLLAGPVSATPRRWPGCTCLHCLPSGGKLGGEQPLTRS